MTASGAERHSFYIRVVYALCLTGATFTHLRVALAHGLTWDYGGASLFTSVFWTSLLFLDPLAALLLLTRPKSGLALCVAIIVIDVVHNAWYGLSHSLLNPQFISQVVFLGLVVVTVRRAWAGVTPRFAPIR